MPEWGLVTLLATYKWPFLETHLGKQVGSARGRAVAAGEPRAQDRNAAAAASQRGRPGELPGPGMRGARPAGRSPRRAALGREGALAPNPGGSGAGSRWGSSPLRI